MNLPFSDVFEKLGKAIFESPFNAARLSSDIPEIAEIRLAALDAIRRKSHRVAGKMVFPFNLVRIHLSGVPESQAQTWRSDFLSNYFDSELRAGLARSNYRFPDDLKIEMQTNEALPGPHEEWIRVEAESIAKPVAAPESVRRPEGSLLVLQGQAEQSVYALTKVRTNIGRVVDVFKTAGPSRRNDIAFAAETEINRSVSREHAHIIRDRNTGEYRLYNDRWYRLGPVAEANCGLWILRDGASQPVHRNSRGAALQNDDEVHFGRAVVRFTAE